ncbi:MAG: DUF1223 domain-containing protein [Roseovarius sp.]
MTRPGAPLLSLLLLLCLALSSPARAGQQPVLVELFTSQGCSSCPPADELLREMAARPDVVALALHVDYWDYIGWTDSFARPEYSARQRAYAAATGTSMVYTPQMIIDGARDVMGSHPQDVAAAIAERRAAPRRVTLETARANGKLRITARAAPGAQGICAVEMMRYRPHARVEITSGENAGKVMDYANIVTEISTVTEWDMSTPLDIEVPLTGDLPAVVVIQQGRAGPVEAVARID